MTQTEPKVIAKAEFTADMAETLHRYFEHYSAHGVVTVEVTTHGLWLRHPASATRQFLGRADYPDRPAPYHPRIEGLWNG